MQRYGSVIRIAPGKGEEYRRLHAQVWPTVLATIRDCNIRNYSIFVDGPELFGYLECDDWDAASTALAHSDANRRWQELMSDYLATPIDPDASEPLRLLEEVFRMD